MASNCGELQVSGCSQGNFKCKWTIKRFSSLDSRVGIYYLSEVFQLEEEGMQWGLGIYPGGIDEDSKGYISCYPYVSASEEGVKFQFRLSLRNTDGEVIVSGEDCGWIILTYNGYGYSRMIEASDLVPKLVNDTLIVTVEATYCITCVKDDTAIYRDAEITPMVKLAGDLRKMWTSEENSDCVISVAEKDIRVNSAVLCARSEVFSAMFRHETLEKDTRRVEVTDFEKDTMDSFLEFINSGTVLEMNFDLALELLRASDKYEVSDLKSYCSNFLMSLLNDDNVCQILVSADVYNAGKLRRHALKYFNENMSKEFLESQRSIFITRPNLLYDIVKEFIDEKQKCIRKNGSSKNYY